MEDYDYQFTFYFETDFLNINSNSLINVNQIRSEVIEQILLHDYNSISCDFNETELILFISDKLTPLSQTEIDNINSYMNNYTFNPNFQDINIQYHKVIVSKTSGDYNTIKEAIDDGKLNIFIKAHFLPYSIDTYIPNGCKITGEEGVVLENSIIKTNILPVSTTGTSLTATLNSTLITGVSTTFYTDIITNFSNHALYKKYVSLNDVLYEINSITNNTSLTLKENYKNPTQTFTNFSVVLLSDKIAIKNIKLINSEIEFNSTCNSILKNVDVTGSIKIDKSFNTTFKKVNVKKNGVEILNSKFIDIELKCFDNVLSGLYINNSKNVFINNSDFSLNTLHGVFVDTSNNNINISNSRFFSNIENGLYINNTSLGININTNQFLSNKKNGLLLKGENIKILNNTIENNLENGIKLDYKNILIDNNIINSNSLNGICVVSNTNNTKIDSLQLNLNIINNNVERGVLIESNNIENILIKGSRISNNTLEGILFKPTSTTTFTFTKIIVANNNINNTFSITPITSVTSKINGAIISNNFIKSISLGSKTENIKFVDNFYELYSNNASIILGLAANLTDALSRNVNF